MHIAKNDHMVAVTKTGEIVVARGASRAGLRERKLVASEDNLYYNQIPHRCVARGTDGRVKICPPSQVQHGEVVEYLFSRYDAGKYNVVGWIEREGNDD